MVPRLQQILFNLPQTLPDNPAPTRTLRMDAPKVAERGIPMKGTRKLLVKLLTGNKWWSIMEMYEHLKVPKTAIYTTLSRYQETDNIESYSDPRVNQVQPLKYYRIKP